MKKLVYASVAVSLLACMVMAQEADPTGTPPVAIEDTDVVVLVPQTEVIAEDIEKDSYWEPFTDVFGDGTLAMIGGVHAEGGVPDTMNAKVAFVDPDGNISEYWAWYTDAGDPWTDNFNESRTSGNPPRIACDSRPGGTMHYMVGQEATPYWYDEFNTDGRWDGNFEYIKQMAAVQIFDLTPNGPVPITHAFDPIYGVATDIVGTQGDQIRFGGEIICLSDGNFVTIPEDRAGGFFSGGHVAAATLFDGSTGAPIKGPFNAALDDRSSDIWSNATAFNGGWTARLQGVFMVWDNACTGGYMLPEDTFSTMTDTGRGDGQRIGSNIGTTLVYLAGKTPDDMMSLSRFDAAASSENTPVGAKEVYVNGEDYWDVNVFNRAEVACDNAGNSIITWDETFSSENNQTVARIYNADMEPATPIFYPFEHDDWGGTLDFKGNISKETNVSMDDQRIIVATEGIYSLVDVDNQQYIVVLKNPFAPVPVEAWDLY